jgi:hypothetical protein
VVEQVWFCGAHSDVGGGYPEVELSDIPLDWMVEKAQTAGLAFDKEAIGAYPLHSNPLGELHNSKVGLYRVTIGIDRAIGLATGSEPNRDESAEKNDPTQAIHASVLSRWDRDPNYRPGNLQEYFVRVGDARVK